MRAERTQESGSIAVQALHAVDRLHNVLVAVNIAGAVLLLVLIHWVVTAAPAREAAESPRSVAVAARVRVL